MNIPDISYISPEQSNTNNPNKVQSDVNHLPPSYINPTSTSPPFHTPQAQTSPFYASQAQTQTLPPFYASQAQAQTSPSFHASQAQTVPSNTGAHLMQPGVYAPPTLFITAGPMPYQNMIVSGNYIHPETVYIRDYMIWSIINIFLGGLVLGIPAVWLSMVTRDRKQQGDIEGARTMSKITLAFNIIITVLFFILAAFLILYLVIFSDNTSTTIYY
ncbi:unnamed protein product [Adineta steineri]|uniref:Interferon-induced transmembrane protein n=1 Tax=Adineta steineri TaxID=433720 RepID=A0A815BDF3_9BILA|nr:unnamed protein product [Adineta steineri]